ncbi:MAG: winged helix-turn-helix domain-containing protein [Chloroflexota bacterium]
MVTTATPYYTRSDDLSYLTGCIARHECCAIVGLSNMGKSSILRQIRQPQILADLSQLDAESYGFFYVDLNLQLQMTQQGFYELVLRTIINELKSLQTDPAIVDQVQAAYERVVEPTDDFQNALSFNEAIIALCENWPRKLVLIFDEFDLVYQGIDSRVFLNLRALRDRYSEHLMYIAAVTIPLADSRHNADDGEFAELFAHNTHYVKPLTREDVTYIVKTFSEDLDLEVSEKDSDFIFEESGGHPGLLEVVCQVYARSLTPDMSPNERWMISQFDDNDNIRTECVKLWKNISPNRQKALMNFIASGQIATDLRQELLRKGILFENPDKSVRVFGKLFEDFVRRFQLVYEEPKKGLLIDIESGGVYIDGQAIDSLTNLEYRLLLLLYGNLDKICDKYRIVEAVWGEDYIEEVDDARIEKLISRLRQKLEPNPSEPKYLMTVRGRGYRLQNK